MVAIWIGGVLVERWMQKEEVLGEIGRRKKDAGAPSFRAQGLHVISLATSRGAQSTNHGGKVTKAVGESRDWRDWLDWLDWLAASFPAVFPSLPFHHALDIRNQDEFQVALDRLRCLPRLERPPLPISAKSNNAFVLFSCQRHCGAPVDRNSAFSRRDLSFYQLSRLSRQRVRGASCPLPTFLVPLCELVIAATTTDTTLLRALQSLGQAKYLRVI